MNGKGQFVTVFFAVLLISVVLAVFALESNNLQSSQNVNLLRSTAASSTDMLSNLAYQYTFFQSGLPSSSAKDSFLLSLSSIASEYFANYAIDFTNGISISSGSQNAGVHSLALKIANSQSSATPSPFQQMVVINSSQYSQYESNTLQNIQFSYSNGTIIPSWLESGNIANFTNGTSDIQLPNSTTTYSLWHGSPEATFIIWIKGNLTNKGCDHYPCFGLIQVDQGCTSGPEVYAHNSTHFYVRELEWDSFWYANRSFYCGGAQSSPATPVPYGKWEMVTFMLKFNGNVSSSWLVSCVGTQCYNSTYTLPRPAAYDTGAMSIGSYQFGGQLANLQIYNTTLSMAQISTLNSEGMNAAPPNTKNLIAWLPLAGSANDRSGNGNTGTSNNIIYNYVGSASTNTTYWLKLASIPADSSTTVYMSFYPTNYNLFNTVDTGEAPQFSSTYAQYDDGANVFNLLYDNFLTSSLNTTIWGTTSLSSASTFGDGWYMNSTGTYEWIISKNSLPANSVGYTYVSYIGASNSGLGSGGWATSSGGSYVSGPYASTIGVYSSIQSSGYYYWVPFDTHGHSGQWAVPYTFVIAPTGTMPTVTISGFD